MDFVDADFFANKITVGVNRVNRKFDCSYIVAKDASGFDELLQFRKNARFVFSRYESGDVGNPLNDVEYEHWVFDVLLVRHCFSFLCAEIPPMFYSFPERFHIKAW